MLPRQQLSWESNCSLPSYFDDSEQGTWSQYSGRRADPYRPRSNLYFRPPRNQSVLAVRAVRGAHLGKLITVRGIVTRVSEVKPLLLVNAYTCDMCGNEIFQEIAQKSFTPLQKCPSATCHRNGAQGNLHMQTRASRFRPFQEVKIQEMVSRLEWYGSSFVSNRIDKAF